MKKQIIPALIAKNQKELNKRFGKVKSLSNVFHLDIMDGKFVKNKSLMFDFKLPRNKKYVAHLMIKNPENWINKNWRKADTIIFHFEATKNPESIIKLIKSKRRKVGLALNPKTQVNGVGSHLKSVNIILIMTVNPGRYGAKFLPKTLKKIRELRKLKPNLSIFVDGGINPKTIRSMSRAGASTFVSGSYLQKAGSPEKAIKELARLSK